MSDTELLEQFVRDNSQPAFAELVRRHVDWVYSAALRRVRDRHLAEDVTQAAFALLAQKAKSLGREKVLAAWLFHVVQFVAMRVHRDEQRRLRRESTVIKSEQEPDQSVNQEWEQLIGLLDDAVLRLREEDRQAVLLRFFQKKSFAEVGMILGISEEAARKRTSRATDKLRGMLSAKGVSMPATALTTVLLVEVTKSAPAALAATISATGATSASAALIKGAVIAMAISKAKAGLLTAVLAILLVGGGSFVTMKMLHHEDVAITPATRPTAATSAPPVDAVASFIAAYKLTDGQILKHMPPPFIPQRTAYVKQILHGGRDMLFIEPQIGFRWDGAILKWQTMSTTTTKTIDYVLTNILQIKPYDLELPPSILSFDASGDWVIGADVPTDQALAALSQIILSEHGKRVRFESRLVEQDVFVVTGQYEFKQIPDQKPCVHVYVDMLDEDDGVIFSDPFPRFIERLGSEMHIRIVDETQPPMPSRIRWTGHQSSRQAIYERTDPQRNLKLRRMLDAVSSQTGLKFTSTRRMFDVWCAVETP